MYCPVVKLPANQATRHARFPGWGLGRFAWSLGFNQATRHPAGSFCGAGEKTVPTREEIQRGITSNTAPGCPGENNINTNRNKVPRRHELRGTLTLVMMAQRQL